MFKMFVYSLPCVVIVKSLPCIVLIGVGLRYKLHIREPETFIQMQFKIQMYTQFISMLILRESTKDSKLIVLCQFYNSVHYKITIKDMLISFSFGTFLTELLNKLVFTTHQVLICDNFLF